MKTIEEKAKRYDELSKEVLDYFNGKTKMFSDVNKTLELLFPELKCSEDEKIRKEIIYHIQHCDDTIDEVAEKRMIAWLEKQGDQDKLIKELGEYKVKYTQELLEKNLNTISDKDDERLRNTTISFLADYAAQGYENAVECIDWLKKQGEQKQDPCEHCDDVKLNCYNFPCIKKEAFEQGKSALEAIKEEKVDNANKVDKNANKSVDNYKPKFNIGDYIVNDYCKGTVIQITNDAYLLDTEQGIPFSAEHNAHLWTLNDAHDGDILSTYDGKPFIFKGFLDKNKPFCPVAYCGINYLDYLVISNGNEWWTDKKVRPSTKKECEILLEKIKNEGCEFNFETKQLLKVKTIRRENDDKYQLIKKYKLALNSISNLCDGAYDTADDDYPGRPFIDEVRNICNNAIKD